MPSREVTTGRPPLHNVTVYKDKQIWIQVFQPTANVSPLMDVKLIDTLTTYTPLFLAQIAAKIIMYAYGNALITDDELEEIRLSLPAMDRPIHTVLESIDDTLKDVADVLGQINIRQDRRTVKQNGD